MTYQDSQRLSHTLCGKRTKLQTRGSILGENVEKYSEICLVYLPIDLPKFVLKQVEPQHVRRPSVNPRTF